MNHQVNFRPRVITNSCVRVTRKIKGTGTLTVAKNQEVSPHDVLGTSLLSPGFTVINLAKELKLSPVKALKSLQKPVGTPIYKGELLAKSKTLFGSKNVTAPTDCMIESFNGTNGDLTLKMLPKQLPLLAGTFGIVDEVNTLTGEVYIKTMATQVVGVFGSGRERGGFLKVIGTRSDLLNASNLSSNMKGTILVTGGLIFKDALKKAVEYQIDGLVSGGLNSDDYLSIAGSLYANRESHTDIGMSLLSTEGYGPMAIGEDIYSTLTRFEGNYVFINGFNSHLVLPETSADSIIKARKIALPPLVGGVKYTPDNKIVNLTTGLKVRLVWPPFAGSQGTIISIDGVETTLPSGIAVHCALVELSNKKIKVPITNLEAI